MPLMNAESVTSSFAKSGRKICCAAEPGNLPRRAKAMGVFYIDLSVVAPLYFADMDAAALLIQDAHAAVDSINQIFTEGEKTRRKYPRGFHRLEQILSLNDDDHPDLKKLPQYQRDKSETFNELLRAALKPKPQNPVDAEDALSHIFGECLSFLDKPRDVKYPERLK